MVYHLIFSKLLFLLHLFLLSVKQVQQVDNYWNTNQDESHHVETSQRHNTAQILGRNTVQVLWWTTFGLGKLFKPGLYDISRGDFITSL